MNRYKGVAFYYDGCGVWKAQVGNSVIARCATQAGVKRAITACHKR